MDRDPRWLVELDRAMTILGYVVVAIAIGFFAAHIAFYVTQGGSP